MKKIECTAPLRLIIIRKQVLTMLFGLNSKNIISVLLHLLFLVHKTFSTLSQNKQTKYISWLQTLTYWASNQLLFTYFEVVIYSPSIQKIQGGHYSKLRICYYLLCFQRFIALLHFYFEILKPSRVFICHFRKTIFSSSQPLVSVDVYKRG